MPKTIISEGKTSTEAIEKGLKELKANKSQVDIKIIEEKKKSFFSILDPHVVKVEITLKEENNSNKEEKIIKFTDLEEAKKNVDDFLNRFLKLISQEIEYKTEIKENEIYVLINGNDSVKLIGYRGEALNSLQLILLTIAGKNNESNIKVILDIGNYKETRKKTLEDLAEKVSKTVIKTGKPITLEPMTPYERKIIHTKLQENKSIKTHSIGEGDKRRVVIEKNNQKNN